MDEDNYTRQKIFHVYKQVVFSHIILWGEINCDQQL